MKKTLTLLVSGLVLFASSTQAATVLAKVGNTTITLEDFNRKYDENRKFFQGRVPSKKDVLSDLIKREVGVQEAKRLGMEKDPDVQDRMQTILFQTFIEKQLQKQFDQIHITDPMAKSFYERYPEIRTSNIFVAVAPGASLEDEKAAKDKLLSIRSQHLSGGKMSFAEAAQKFSEAPDAPTGGDLDYQTRDKLDPAYYAAARKLSVGQVSDPVRSSLGWHLIKVTAIRPWSAADHARFKRLAFEEEKQKIFDRYMSSLQSKAKVSVNDSLLK